MVAASRSRDAGNASVIRLRGGRLHPRGRRPDDIFPSCLSFVGEGWRARRVPVAKVGLIAARGRPVAAVVEGAPRASGVTVRRLQASNRTAINGRGAGPALPKRPRWRISSSPDGGDLLVPLMTVITA